MATANQLKTLIKSHFEDNSEKFNTVALQIAAYEAKLGQAAYSELKKNAAARISCCISEVLRLVSSLFERVIEAVGV